MATTVKSWLDVSKQIINPTEAEIILAVSMDVQDRSFFPVRKRNSRRSWRENFIIVSLMENLIAESRQLQKSRWQL